MTITVDHVSFTYPETAETPARKVLSDISFSFSEEQPLVLVGPSGAGKTTLMRILLGFLKPDEGTIRGISKETVFSVVFQEDRLFDELDLKENWRLVSPRLSDQDLLEMARRLGLEEAFSRKPSQLSGGMKRRAAVGRALLFPADVYLMDEPFAGLDEKTRRQTAQAILQAAAFKPLLVISHEPQEAADLGARAVSVAGKVLS